VNWEKLFVPKPSHQLPIMFQAQRRVPELSAAAGQLLAYLGDIGHPIEECLSIVPYGSTPVSVGQDPLWP